MQLGLRGTAAHDGHRDSIKPSLLATEDTDPHEDTLPVSSSVCQQPSRACTPDLEEREAAAAASASSVQSNSVASKLAAAVHGYLWSSGTLCVLAAALIFSVSALLVKLTGNRIPVLQITLVRSSLSWLVGVTLCWQQGISPMFGHRERLGWLVMRGLSGASAMTTYYVSLLLLPMADAVTLFFLNPTLTAILVWLVRGEHLGWLGAAGCLSSFSGLLLLVHPPFLFGGHQDWGYARSMGVVAGLVSSCLCAAAFLCIRMIGKEEPALVVALWFHTATLVVSSLPLAVGWPQKAVVMSGREWGLLLGVAGTSFMGQLLMTRGFQLMPASRASSVNMTQVIYSAAFGILVFHEHLTLMGLLGTCLITAGVAAVNAKPAPAQPAAALGTKQQQQQQQQQQQLQGQEAAAKQSDSRGRRWLQMLGGQHKAAAQPYLPLSNQQEQHLQEHVQQHLVETNDNGSSCIPAAQQPRAWGSFSIGSGSFSERLTHPYEQQQPQQQSLPQQIGSSHQSVMLVCPAEPNSSHLFHRHHLQDVPGGGANSSWHGSLPDEASQHSSMDPHNMPLNSSWQASMGHAERSRYSQLQGHLPSSTSAAATTAHRQGEQTGHMQRGSAGMASFVLEEEELATVTAPGVLSSGSQH